MIYFYLDKYNILSFKASSSNNTEVVTKLTVVVTSSNVLIVNITSPTGTKLLTSIEAFRFPKPNSDNPEKVKNIIFLNN